MEHDDGLTLKELCEEADVSERTIRYYMTQGLVPPAPRSGPGVRYPRGHLARLKLIRRWQEEYLPLEQIRKLLSDLSESDVVRLASTPHAEGSARPKPGPKSSVADYVQQVLGRTAKPSPREEPPESPSLAPIQELAPEPARSQWERWVLDEDIELHIRRPLSHLKNRRVEALLAEARRILKPRA
jgi:DNA-binding transcriptional MerR regulator